MNYWKTYTYWYSGLMVFWIIMALPIKSISGAILSLIFGGATLIALLGLVKREAYLKPWVWKFLFVIQMLIAVLAVVIAVMFTINGITHLNANVLIVVIPTIVSLIFVAPAIFGTYWYAFKDEEVWKNAI
jgi:hypothetical protein